MKETSPREEKFDLGGGESMAVYTYGTGEKSICFLHGTGVHPWSYEELYYELGKLRPDYNIRAISGPGEGKTPTLKDDEGVGDRVVAYVKANDIRSAYLVGHSRGGVEAVRAAIDLSEDKDKGEVPYVVSLAGPATGTRGVSTPELLSRLSLDAIITQTEEWNRLLFRGQYDKMAKLSQSALAAYIESAPNMIGELREFENTKRKMDNLSAEPVIRLAKDGLLAAFFARNDLAFPYSIESRNLPKGTAHEVKEGGHGFPISHPEMTAEIIAETIFANERAKLHV